MSRANTDPQRGLATLASAVVAIALLGSVVAGAALAAPAAVPDPTANESTLEASSGDDSAPLDAELSAEIDADVSTETDAGAAGDADAANDTESTDGGSLLNVDATLGGNDSTASVDAETSLDGGDAATSENDTTDATGDERSVPDPETATTAGVDASLEATTDDGLDANLEAETAAGNATVDADARADEPSLHAALDSEVGTELGLDATLVANGSGVVVSAESAEAAEAESAQDEDAVADGSDDGTSTENGQDDGTDAASGDEEKDDSLPVPDRRTGGVALGTVLVGAGLAARRAGTVAVASGGANGATLSAALETLRAWWWRLLGVAGYQRYDDTDPLEHETRAAIYDHVRASPGTFLTEIGEATDVPLSTVRYHVRILAFENLLTEVTVRGKRRFFPADVDPDALEPALADEGTAAVLEALAEEPDSVSGLAERIDRDPSTVSHHLQRLEADGLVERERQGRSVINRLADGLDDAAFDGDGRVASTAD